MRPTIRIFRKLPGFVALGACVAAFAAIPAGAADSVGAVTDGWYSALLTREKAALETPTDSWYLNARARETAALETPTDSWYLNARAAALQPTDSWYVNTLARTRSNVVATTPIVVSSPSGFSWGDFGYGVAAALGAIGIVVLLRTLFVRGAGGRGRRIGTSGVAT